MLRAWALVAILVGVAAPSPAAADDLEAEPEPAPAPEPGPGGGELRYDPVVSATLTIGTGLAWVATEAVWKDAFAPDDCRWCETNGLDDAVRDALVWDDTTAARDASNAIGFLLVPAAGYSMLGLASWHDDRVGNWVVDGLIVTEAAILAMAANQAVKFAVGRERPFVHQLADDAKPLTDEPQDNNLSFYSGHASLAFAFAASAGTVAHMRGYRWAPWVWGVGGALAVTTSYLRIAADKHWFTDVVVGAGVSTAMGIATTYFLHRPRRGAIDSVHVTPAAGGGATLSVGGRW